MDNIYPFDPLRLSQHDLSIRVDTVQRSITRPIWKVEAGDDELPKLCFGPYYGNPASSSLTESTFDYIASKSSTNVAELLQAYKESIDNEGWKYIKSSYRDSRGRIESMPDEVFKSMMIHGACTMLLRTMYLLGHSPDNEEPFARTCSPDEYYGSIFFPGNQICNFMLQKLLEQDFFKQIIEKTKWRTPSDLFGKALYLCVLKPKLKIIDQVSCWGTPKTRILDALKEILFDWGATKTNILNGLKEEPSDVLHALHLSLLGEGDDLFSNNRVSSIFDDRFFPTVVELNKKGISFNGMKNMGIRGLQFKSNYFGGGELCMPIIPADEHIGLVFQMLTKYECTPNFTSEEREVTSYLGLLKDIIHTIPDTNMLARKGILGGDLIFRNNFAIMLGRMHCSITCEHIKYVKLQVRGYTGVNWQKLWITFKVIASLSILPTVYSILQYYKKENSPMHQG